MGAEKGDKIVMSYSVSRFLYSVLKRRLDMESQRWFAALESGFDVVVVAEERLLFAIIPQYLSQSSIRQSKSKFRFQNFSTPDAATHDNISFDQNLNRAKFEDVLPRISLHSCEPPPGHAAIVFRVPSLMSLLPTPSTMVLQILESSKLERYVEAFDGQKMVTLRRMLEKAGPECFFDGVIQIAYLAGYRGDDAAAFEALRAIEARALDELAMGPKKGDRLPSAPLKRADALGAVFEKFIQLPDPHDVLKAALAHYVLQSRKITQAEASRLLKVSRSTLQAHLQLAERLNVAAFFQPDEVSVS